MKTGLLVLLLSVLLMSIPLRAADKPSDARVKAELKRLQGTWQLVKEINDGKEMPANDAGKTRVIFDADGKWQVEFDGKIVGEGTLTLDPRKKPKTIDYLITEGADKDKTFTAIYELDRTSFKHCGVLEGARPKAFESKPGSGHMLTMFRRIS